jgi:predicted metal-dependent phosphoesterase TrpH
MADIDLHSHSRFFHAFTGRETFYDEIGLRTHVAVARARGLDAIAVTNHDYYTEFDVDTGDLTLLPGIEVSSTAGHLLVVGPDPPQYTKPERMTPEEVVDLAHGRDCAVIMAHPFRNSRIKETDVAVDAVEVNGKRSQSPTRIEELAAKLDLPLVGGSDAHFPIEIGRTFTTMDVEQVTPEAVVDAIREGRTDYEIIHRFPDRYIKQLYGVIHRLKGHTARATEAVKGAGSKSDQPTDRADGRKRRDRPRTN